MRISLVFHFQVRNLIGGGNSKICLHPGGTHRALVRSEYMVSKNVSGLKAQAWMWIFLSGGHQPGLS